MVRFQARFNGCCFGGDWKVGIRIGACGSSQIHSASSSRLPGYFAVKIEPKRPFFHSLLKDESAVYEKINQLEGESNIGFLSFYGLFKESRFYAFVLQPVGKSVGYYFRQLHSFSSKTVNMIAIQALNRLMVLHNAGFLHTAVNPENLSLGGTELHSTTIFLHNLQYAVECDSNGLSINFSKNPDIVFSSHGLQEGAKLSAQDDLISLTYTLLYLLDVHLPWRDLASIVSKKNRNRAIHLSKLRNTIAELSVHCPDHFKSFVRDVAAITGGSLPNYVILRSYFHNAMQEEGQEYDARFDWVDTALKYERSIST